MALTKTPVFAGEPLTIPPPIEVAGRWIKRYHVTACYTGAATAAPI